MTKLYMEIPGPVSCSYRYLTPDEEVLAREVMARREHLLKIIEESQKELKEIANKYKETRIFKDDPGYTYDIRTYVLTGEKDFI